MSLPTTTMAVRVFEHGGRDKLIYDEYPLPELGEHDVLVKVHTASVSFYDVKYREGIAAASTGYKLPQQLGREAAGEVVAVGRAVQRFKPRSEERRVGKEGRSRGSPDDEKKKKKKAR